MKKQIAIGVLTVMAVGFVTNGLAMWRNHGVLEARVKTVENKQETQDNTNNEIREQINAIHWYLIESKGVVVPKRRER